MTWNKHERFLQMTESELLAYLRQHGYVFTREHYPFGRVLTFADVESGVHKYYIEGGLRDWPEVQAWLRETWLPVASEDRAWFEQHVG